MADQIAALLAKAAPLVAQAAKYVKADHAKYFLWAVLGGGVFPKLLAAVGAGPMVKEFPKLPRWFWLPCAAWELAGVLALTTDVLPATVGPFKRAELGFLLTYSYLGGIFANNWLIHLNAKSIPATVFTVLTIAATATFGFHNGVKAPTTAHAHAVIGGFVIGTVISLFSVSPKKGKKN